LIFSSISYFRPYLRIEQSLDRTCSRHVQSSMIAQGDFCIWQALRRRVGTTAPKSVMTNHQQGEWAMRFIFGLIVGIGLTIGGAAIHDFTMDAGVSKPLVNWTTANELQQTAFDYVRAQIDRLVKWATSS
jgi:hypothetical protein